VEWPRQRQVKTLLAILSPKSPFAPSIDAARTEKPVALPLRNNQCSLKTFSYLIWELWTVLWMSGFGRVFFNI
jgi:hypothetical protein